jgi:FixJ family two-component response regulator
LTSGGASPAAYAHSLPTREPAVSLDQPTVLIVDSDPTMHEILTAALRPLGVTARSAGSGVEGLTIARSNRLDLMLIELRLPDMPGMEVVRLLREDGLHVPFVLISGSVTVPMTVEAMRLGAIDVIEKPLAVDKLISILPIARDRPRVPRRPRSVAERWALYVLKACESDGDLKTLEAWARFLGVSYSSLCESCRLLGVRPHAARDLSRVLRAVLKASAERCRFEVLLDISDRRTLNSLLARAGFDESAPGRCMSLQAFLDGQRFVPPDNEGVILLRHLLLESGHDSRWPLDHGK